MFRFSLLGKNTSFFQISTALRVGDHEKDAPKPTKTQPVKQKQTDKTEDLCAVNWKGFQRAHFILDGLS